MIARVREGGGGDVIGEELLEFGREVEIRRWAV